MGASSFVNVFKEIKKRKADCTAREQADAKAENEAVSQGHGHLTRTRPS
jgi:hypothetical protein